MKTIKKLKLKQNNNKEFKITGFYPNGQRVNGQSGEFDRYRVSIKGREVIFDEPILKELFEEPFEVQVDEKGNEIKPEKVTEKAK
jgi:hypothetical protein